METTMGTLTKKLFAQREAKAHAKPDYAKLMEAVYGEREETFNVTADDAEFTEAVNNGLSTLRKIEQYCLEERYLYGKPLEQLTDEFRSNLDMEEFADEIIENVYSSIKNEFMENIEVIFSGMEDNSFRELEYQDGLHPESLPKNDTYYELKADKSVVDVLRDTLQRFDGVGLSYKDIFENCFMKGQTKEELAVWLSEHMDEYVFDICRTGLRKLRIRYSRSDLKKFLGYDKSSENDIYYKKCEKCIYSVTLGTGEEPAECSECKTAEVKEWLDSALSELPPNNEQVIRSLYDLEDGHHSRCGYKNTAIKLSLDSKEEVIELEKSALKALKSKAKKDFGKQNNTGENN